MNRRREKTPYIRMTVAFRTLVLAVLACGVPAALTPAQAHADEPAIARLNVVAGDGHGKFNHVSIRSGNGKFNKNYSTVLSPTVNRGLQQVSNTNVSGVTNTQVGFCRKRHRYCKISQRLLSGW